MSLSSGPTSRITSGAPDLASPRGLAHAELDPRGSYVSGHPHADRCLWGTVHNAFCCVAGPMEP